MSVTVFHVSLRCQKPLVLFEQEKQVYSENTHVEIGLKSLAF